MWFLLVCVNILDILTCSCFDLRFPWLDPGLGSSLGPRGLLFMFTSYVFHVRGLVWFVSWIWGVGFGVFGVFTCRTRVIAYLHVMFSLLHSYLYTCDHLLYIPVACIMIYPVRVDLGVDIICIASRASFHEACWRSDVVCLSLYVLCVVWMLYRSRVCDP